MHQHYCVTYINHEDSRCVGQISIITYVILIRPKYFPEQLFSDVCYLRSSLKHEVTIRMHK